MKLDVLLALKRVAGLRPTIKSCTQAEPIGLLVFLADLMDMLDSCDVYEGDTV